ncbi:MAG: methyltransferase domain-containing protein [Cyanobacteria bacterium P01_G01_bin.54]
MSQLTNDLPYIDLLLKLLAANDPDVATALGCHIHWGYWPDPSQAKNTATDYAQAAENLTRQVYGAAQVGDGMQILDVGCGIGGTIASLNDQFSNLHLTGLNIDPRQLEKARATVTAHESNMITFVEGDACALPFPDASFDRLLAVECIFHFGDRQRFFQEAVRVLKPGGKFALSDFLPVSWLIPGLQLSAALPGVPSFYGNADCSFTAADYSRLAQETGFRLTCSQDITHNTLPTYDFLLRLGVESASRDWVGGLQTWVMAGLAQAHWLNYFVLGFEKPGA